MVVDTKKAVGFLIASIAMFGGCASGNAISERHVDAGVVRKEINNATHPVTVLESTNYQWFDRHDAIKAIISSRPVDLVFIGDSITHRFGGTPFEKAVGDVVWEKYYGHRNAVNMGFGWDRTQNVLWRLKNGEFDQIEPVVVVLMIGTNNLTGTEHARENTPSEIAEGVGVIVSTIHEWSPQTAILLLGVLPRNPKKKFAQRIKALNSILSRYESYSYVHYMDLAPFFSDDSYSPIPTYMLDATHLNETGYWRWAEVIEPKIRSLISMSLN